MRASVAGCGCAIPATARSAESRCLRGAEAFWDRERKATTCVACASATTPEAGAAGASAESEGERRKAKRVEDVRKKHGDHAAAVAEAMAAKDIAASWGKGSAGESWLAKFVEQKVGNAVIALHDRLIPGTEGNIDHIFVAPTGVWVVDAKAYKGRVVKKAGGPLWREQNEVYVGGRKRTNLAEAVNKQVDCVLVALKPAPAAKGTNVYGALCFTESEWALLDRPFQVGNIWVLYPRALCKRLTKKGPLERSAMERLATRLDLSLPRAAS